MSSSKHNKVEIVSDDDGDYNVDAIVVMGHYCNPKGIISDRQKSIANKAVEIHMKYPNSKIITCGGSGGLFNRTDISLATRIKLYIQQLGVENQNILVEDKSMNTKEQANYVLEMAKANHFYSIVVVTFFPHILRTRHLFENVFDKSFHLIYVVSDYWCGPYWTLWAYPWEIAGWTKIAARAVISNF